MMCVVSYQGCEMYKMQALRLNAYSEVICMHTLRKPTFQRICKSVFILKFRLRFNNLKRRSNFFLTIQRFIIYKFYLCSFIGNFPISLSKSSAYSQITFSNPYTVLYPGMDSFLVSMVISMVTSSVSFISSAAIIPAASVKRRNNL